MNSLIEIDRGARLYMLRCGSGYSCLGFDVCADRAQKYADWLGETFKKIRKGTKKAYAYYRELSEKIRQRYERTKERCPVELTPQLIGLEGKRVEVVDRYGDKRRFWVGRSTGWIPIHLEIARTNCYGGGGAYGAPFKSVRVVREKR